MEHTIGQDETKRLLIPSLAISASAIQPSAILISLLLIEIGNSFNQPIGIMGQIQTVASIVGAFTAILMGLWSVRYQKKALLLLGLVIYGFSAIGCFLATNFFFMLIAYGFSGVAVATVLPMVYALIGDHLPVEKRTIGISTVLASIASFSIISSLFIGFVTKFLGWRDIFLVYVIPISLLSIIIAFLGISSTKNGEFLPKNEQKQYLDGFKGIIKNRSALACQIGNIMTTTVWATLVLYISSFLRNQFNVLIEIVSVIFIIAALANILGNIIATKIINKIGKKSTAVISTFLVGIFIIIFLNIPFLEFSIIMGIIASLFYGIFSTTFISLSLEQEPQFRGSMMSLNSASSRFGEFLGAGIGGVIIEIFRYGALGFFLGLMSFSAVLVIYLFVIDPNKLDLERMK